MTQTVTLYIATGLNGMIASPDGSVDWQLAAHRAFDDGLLQLSYRRRTSPPGPASA